MFAPLLNYTLQDLLGALFGFVLFPLVLIAPGYCLAWLLDLFEFRNRLGVTRWTIALVISFAISPILLFLTARLFSMQVAVILVSMVALAFIVIKIKEGINLLQGLEKYKINILAAGVWALIAILSLVDLHWDHQLFLTVVSYDLTTRISIVDAITRTGVPPVNPGFYPGQPVPMTLVYYFWYILTSLIDILGSSIVDARLAQIAISAWTGIGLMAAIALYLRLRNPREVENSNRSYNLGHGLLFVSGLDAVPLLILMLGSRTLLADVEHWNTQITAWVGSLLWAPHHVAALIACLVAVLVGLDFGSRPEARILTPAIVAGIAFASAIGMSVWVTVVFAFFWCIWLVTFLHRRIRFRLVIFMIITGLISLVLASPFLAGMTFGDGGTFGRFPLSLEVRTFYPLLPYVESSASSWRSWLMLAALPLNYALELGFFFIVGVAWISIKQRQWHALSPFHRAEVLLLIIVVLSTTFLRSTLLLNNDFGWRAWLPGQFVLLVWGVDIVQAYWNQHVLTPSDYLHGKLARTRLLLLSLLTTGALTTLIVLFTLRFSSPLLSGVTIGESRYSARLAFDFLRDRVSSSLVTQTNPLVVLDRPSGLYGRHQMALSDRTPYGIPSSQYEAMLNNIGAVFLGATGSRWDSIDKVCLRYGIDVLIFQDNDPVWQNLPTLALQRPSLYENPHYRIFTCGEFARQ